MARKRRSFTPQFEAQVGLEAVRERESVKATATRHELHPKIGELAVERDFFSARTRSLSRADRIRMIDRASPMSLSKQCRLLGVSRSSRYYEPKSEGEEELALMWRLDDLPVGPSLHDSALGRPVLSCLSGFGTLGGVSRGLGEGQRSAHRPQHPESRSARTGEGGSGYLEGDFLHVPDGGIPALRAGTCSVTQDLTTTTPIPAVRPEFPAGSLRWKQIWPNGENGRSCSPS